VYFALVAATLLAGFLSTASLPEGEPSLAFIWYVLIALPWTFLLPGPLSIFGAVANALLIAAVEMHIRSARMRSRDTN
jgi:hypothetical protein